MGQEPQIFSISPNILKTKTVKSKSKSKTKKKTKSKSKAPRIVVTGPWLKAFAKKLKTLLDTHPKLVHIEKLESFRFRGKKVAVHGWYEAVPSRNYVRISLDYRRELFPTLIHESLHHFYPKMPERLVGRYERKIIDTLTTRQVRVILKKLANNI